jgi:hypothetical protein
MEEVDVAFKKGLISEMAAHDFGQLIFKICGCFATIYDYDGQPFPFLLTHFIVLMAFIFLPLILLAGRLARAQ